MSRAKRAWRFNLISFGWSVMTLASLVITL
jgi:hypothetical protein